MIKVTDQQVREAQDGELLIVERSANTPANPNRLPMGVYYRFKGATKSIFSFIQQSGSAAWGSITGTLSDQTDLQNALDVKLDNPNGTSSEFIKGDGSLDSTAYQTALGFTPEDVANKKTTMSGNTTSNTFYLTAKAIYDWATSTFQSALGYTAENVANKSSSYTSSSTTTYANTKALVDGLATKQNSLGYTAEDVANKSTSVVTDQASNTKYPSVKAVYDWAVGAFQASLGFTPENVANKATTMTGNTGSNTLYLTAKAVYDWGVATFTTTSAVASQITTALTGYATEAWVALNYQAKLTFTPVQVIGIDFTKNVLNTNVTNQVVGSVLIPANTFGSGSALIEIETAISRINGGVNPNHRLYINTSVAFSGATQLSLISTTPAARYVKGERTFEIGTNFIRGFANNLAGAIDDASVTSAPSQATINWAVNQYILTVIDNATAVDTSQHEFTSVELKKV